jgi:hypothetical protein
MVCLIKLVVSKLVGGIGSQLNAVFCVLSMTFK